MDEQECIQHFIDMLDTLQLLLQLLQQVAVKAAINLAKFHMQNWLVSPPDVAKEEMFSQGVSVISYEKVTDMHLVTPVTNHLKKN